MQISISKTNFTSIFANNIFRNRISIRIFDFLHQNSRTKSRRNQQFARLFRLFYRLSLQHQNRYSILHRYYQNVHIFLLRHSILHQNKRKSQQC